jgi:thioredoxin-like negative regulator of GroEL
MQLANGYMQAQQHTKVVEVLDQILANPQADGPALVFTANLYAQLGHIGKVEQALAGLLKASPENPEGHYDLAAVRAIQNKTPEALDALRTALQQSAARQQRDPRAPNLYSNMLGDARFAGLRASPDFAKILDAFKPK